jgi:hypothetical protein
MQTVTPWKLKETESAFVILAEADDFPIAVIEKSDPLVNEYDRLKEDRANAVLLLAAPNLKDALEMALDALNDLESAKRKGHIQRVQKVGAIALKMATSKK